MKLPLPAGELNQMVPCMDHLMDLCTQSNLEKILKVHPSCIALHETDWSILSASHSLKDINLQNIHLYTSCILLFVLRAYFPRNETRDNYTPLWNANVKMTIFSWGCGQARTLIYQSGPIIMLVYTSGSINSLITLKIRMSLWQCLI